MSNPLVGRVILDLEIMKEPDAPIFDSVVADLGDPWTRWHRALDRVKPVKRATQRARKRAQRIVDTVGG